MEQFWTEELYEKAYDIVKNRRFPIVIPSCNRPNPIILNTFLKEDYNGDYWPVYFIVRNSQEEEYRKSITRPNTYIVGFEDNLIDDYGKAKQMCLDFAYSQKFDYIFSLDDDLEDLGFNILTKSGVGNPRAGSPDYKINNNKFLALWQLASEICFNKYNVLYVSTNLKSTSWPIINVDQESSIKLISGKSPMQALNIKELHDKPYKFRSDKEVGFSDLDFIINLYANGDYTAMLPWLYYDMPADGVSLDNYPYYNSLKERLITSMDKLFALHPDKNFISRRDQKNKALGILPGAGIKINTVRVRKNIGLENYKHNVYKDIKEEYNI